MKRINSALVLGANSEIASKIIVQLAINGCKKFCLIQRNQKNIKKLMSSLQIEYDLDIIYENCDLLEENKPQENLYIDYDLYIVTAGYLGKKSNKKTISEEIDIFKVNFISIIPWIKSIVTDQRIKRKGSLWIFSSVAGDIGRPSNYQYGAAKSALTTYCEGLLHYCNGRPFSIRIIKAGLIKTKMSIDAGPKFLMADPDEMAKYLLNDPYKNGVEYQPFFWKIVMFFLKFAPSFVINKL